MTKHTSMQTITTPGGETLVVLLEDYKALLDARGMAEGRTALANVEAGRDELIPADIVKKLLARDNPLRVWREHRGCRLAIRPGWPIRAPQISPVSSLERRMAAFPPQGALLWR